MIVSFRTVPQRLKAVRSSVPKVSADTNVRIFVAEDDGDDAPIEVRSALIVGFELAPAHTVVQLEGTYSAAFKAFTLLQVGLYRLATAFKRATVAVPADKVGVVIGAAGRSVREIMASTKAKVSLRASEGGDQARRRAAQVAVVHGPADSVLLACDTIERMVAGASLADALEATRSGLGQVLGWQAVLSRKVLLCSCWLGGGGGGGGGSHCCVCEVWRLDLPSGRVMLCCAHVFVVRVPVRRGEAKGVVVKAAKDSPGTPAGLAIPVGGVRAREDVRTSDVGDDGVAVVERGHAQGHERSSSVPWILLESASSWTCRGVSCSCAHAWTAPREHSCAAVERVCIACARLSQRRGCVVHGIA